MGMPVGTGHGHGVEPEGRAWALSLAYAIYPASHSALLAVYLPQGSIWPLQPARNVRDAITSSAWHAERDAEELSRAVQAVALSALRRGQTAEVMPGEHHH